MEMLSTTFDDDISDQPKKSQEKQTIQESSSWGWDWNSISSSIQKTVFNFTNSLVSASS